MKRIADLELGYSDAENYKRKENKDLFNKVFIRNNNLDRLCEPAISFLVGEKGAGKTAYALYLANNNYKNHFAQLKYVRETDYQNFIALKASKNLTLSDYSATWKVILHLLLAQQVIEREGVPAFFSRFSKFSGLQSAISEYYQGAFSPELAQAIEFVEGSHRAAELLAKYAKVGSGNAESTKITSSRFQMNLFYIQRAFEAAFTQARLDHNYVLFIDGIDIRPASVDFSEYIESIKGLANAVWSLNNDFFSSLKGTGRLRIVLLIRPDIFASLGLQNLNTKSRENSVFLDWRTDYKQFRTSQLFKVIDHLIAAQQDQRLSIGQAWDHYFPWDAPDVTEKFNEATSFISFLRYSYYRPRDIITMLKILQDRSRKSGKNEETIALASFDDPAFKREYSEYLLGEIRDQLSFYYSREDYELFLKFFSFLKGNGSFSFQQYVHSFDNFAEETFSTDTKRPGFMLNARTFLQFLYDLNVICYIDETESDGEYIKWCFRQRSYGNISPKVREGVNYRVFIGLYKALNLGQRIVPPYQVGRPVNLQAGAARKAKNRSNLKVRPR